MIARILPPVVVLPWLGCLSMVTTAVAMEADPVVRPPDRGRCSISAYLDRNYYTAEDEARALLSLDSVPPGARWTAVIEVSTPRGVIEREGIIEGTGTVVLALPLTGMPAGTWPCVLKVVDEERHIIAEQTVALRKEEPAPPGIDEVKVDRERVRVLVGGRAFFPIGLYAVPEKFFSGVSSAGFNAVVRWGSQGNYAPLKNLKTADEKRRALGALAEMHRAARDAGLRVIEWPPQFNPRSGESLDDFDAFVRNELPIVFDTVCREPSLLAYYGPDEPDRTDRSRRSLLGYAEVLRRADPYHPSLMLFEGAVVGSIPSWPEAMDIAGLDYYGLGARMPMVSVYDVARANAEKCHRIRVPYWHVPLLEVMMRSCRPLDGPEQRAQSYLAVIGGADGIIWWEWPARHVRNFEAVKECATEFKELTPVLLEPTPRHSVRPAPHALRDTVKVLVKNHASRTHLICCNASRDPVKATFRLPPGYHGAARVWFEGRAVPIEEERFPDTFEGYGRRVYELEGEWRAGAELRLDLAPAPIDAGKRSMEAADSAPADNLVRDARFDTDAEWTFTTGGGNPDAAHGRIAAKDWDFGDFPVRWTRWRPIAQRSCWELTAGGRCAAIETSDGQATGMFVGGVIVLRPNTSYRFGGVAVCRGGRASMYLQPQGPLDPIRTKVVMVRVEDGTGGWDGYATTFTTTDEASTVRPVVAHGGGPGFSHFAGVFLEKVESIRRKNLVRNSGFEREALPGWPLGWLWNGTPESGSVGRPDSLWASDDRVYHEGTRSLRCTRPAEGGLVISAQQQYFHLDQGKAYTFSVYMKADRPDLAVDLVFLDVARFDSGASRVRVGTAWRRYSWTFTWREKSSDWEYFYLSIFGTGTLWMDAVQLEEGPTPTEYEPGDPEYEPGI